MFQRNRTQLPRDGLALAGWVFADLLLGLMIIFMASQRGEATPSAIVTSTSTPTLAWTLTPLPTVTPTDSPTSESAPDTPTPAPTFTPRPPTLSREPFEFSFDVSADALLRDSESEQAKVIALVQGKLIERNLLDKRAGFVLVFGYSPNGPEGNTIARKVIGILPLAEPNVFKDAQYEELHFLNTLRGRVTIKGYVFSESE